MRAFVAAILPSEAKDALERAQAAIPVGRLTPRDNLHLTLAFLDEQPADALEELHFGLEGLASSRFTAIYDGLDIFGGSKQQLLAARLKAETPLTQLHNRIRGVLRSVGLPPERRRFRPHITLARMSGNPSRADTGRLAALLSSGAKSVLEPFEVSEFALFGSTLRPNGALHDEFARYSLK